MSAGTRVVRYLPHVAAGVAVLAGVVMPGRQEPAEAEVAAAGSGVVRIMPFGDSITVGTGSPGRNGYRIELQSRLAEAGLAFDFVGSQTTGTSRGDADHEGHGGWTIDQLAVDADVWVAAAKPDVVLLHAGTNDVTRLERPAVTAAKLSRLIDRVRSGAPRAAIFVSTIVGTAVPAEDLANRAFNRLIPGVVAGKDANVHLVDQASVAGLDLYDNHHPNGFGYSKMAYAWYRAMRATLRPDWPATADPSAAKRKLLCRHLTRRVCAWWYLRTVVTPAGASEEIWQTRRPAVETFRVRVAGRAEVRTRRVTVWSSTWR
ncbi:SGNH/GDSL hydrolase family protein [Actinoplanes sp. NPDC023714]|uniref:SGNH/GDSL hydrolase family protein n=1 Tax=Actinoplanes sp. NPDC023714 TaxID=3154322 RepID=UPI0033DEEACF